MAGHSAFSNIKHKKERVDAKRGKIFTKLGKELTVAARGGGDPDFNPRLRLAIDKAKASNMPKDNVERAIKKGTGELASEEIFEIRYEGYGPGGVAVVVEAMTDNKNRTAPAVRAAFARYGGNLGETGSVGWFFEKKGIILIPAALTTEEQLMETALEAGAEDITEEEGYFTITTGFTEFEAVRKSLETAGIKYESAEVTMIAKNTVKITDEKQAEQMLKLYDALEDDDDIQDVYANFEIDDELYEKLGR